MEERTCAADDCHISFLPKLPEQKYCSRRCCNRIRVRRLRERRRFHSPDSPGPAGGPPSGGLHATLGGAVEYQRDNSVADLNRYSVKSDTRKPVVPASVNPIAGGEREAA